MRGTGLPRNSFLMYILSLSLPLFYSLISLSLSLFHSFVIFKLSNTVREGCVNRECNKPVKKSYDSANSNLIFRLQILSKISIGGKLRLPWGIFSLYAIYINVYIHRKYGTSGEMYLSKRHLSDGLSMILLLEKISSSIEEYDFRVRNTGITIFRFQT